MAPSGCNSRSGSLVTEKSYGDSSCIKSSGSAVTRVLPDCLRWKVSQIKVSEEHLVPGTFTSVFSCGSSTSDVNLKFHRKVMCQNQV